MGSVAGLKDLSSETATPQMLHQRFDLEKQTLTTQVDQALVFLKSSFAWKETPGVTIGLDVNLTMALRDKFHLHLYLIVADQASHIRHAESRSGCSMPTIPKVV